MTNHADNSGHDSSAEEKQEDDARDASSSTESHSGGDDSDEDMSDESNRMEDEDIQHVERVRRPTTQPVQVMEPELDTAEYPAVKDEEQPSSNAYVIAMREQLRQSRTRVEDDADTAPVTDDDTPTRRRTSRKEHRPTSEHEVVSSRSDRIDAMREALDDQNIECVDLHPLYRFTNEIERLGGIAWTLDAVGETLAHGKSDCTAVVLRLESKRILVWVRDSSHGLLIVAPISSERKILGIVREAEEAHG
jgi:hypothetical protein